MRKTRRIEITAFRRTTTLSADEPDARLTERVPESQNGELSFADDCSARGEQVDVVEAILSSADNVRSPELTRLIEALVVSNGDGSPAAQQVGFSRKRFYAKLRTLGFSIKNLITNLNLLNDHRAATKRVK